MKVGSASQVWAEVGRSDGVSDPKKIAPRCARRVGRSGVPDAHYFRRAVRGGSVSVGGESDLLSVEPWLVGRMVGRSGRPDPSSFSRVGRLVGSAK